MIRTLLFLATVGGALLAPPRPAVPLDSIRLPEGFSISLYHDAVPGARSLCLGAKGTVFVGTRRTGKVYALRDKDGDGKAETLHVIAKGLNQPNGVDE